MSPSMIIIVAVLHLRCIISVGSNNSIVPFSGKEVDIGGSIFRNELEFLASKAQGESEEFHRKETLYRFLTFSIIPYRP